MRKLLSILFLLFALHTLTAAGSDTLMITAFKPDPYQETGVYLKVSNALTREDMVAAEGTESIIDVSDYIGSLLGRQPASGTMSSTVIFSYRVEGNEEPEGNTVSYKLRIDISPLANGNENLTAYYQIGNFDVVFPGNAGEINTSTKDGWKIAYDNTSVRNLTVSTEAVSVGDIKWTISKEPTSGTIPVWIARGAVGMVIDSTDYNSKPFGKYKADVTITLEAN